MSITTDAYKAMLTEQDDADRREQEADARGRRSEPIIIDLAIDSTVALRLVLDAYVAALEHARRLRDERDALRALLRRFVEGINDEWHPLFVGGGPLSDDERALLEEAEAALGEGK